MTGSSRPLSRGALFAVRRRMSTAEILEWTLPPIALVLFGGYVTTYFVVLWRTPLRVNLGLKMALRRRWGAQVVRANEALIAVQALRNTMSATAVFASAAIIVAFFAFQQGGASTASGLALQGVKFYCLGATLVAAFLVFGISVREAEHCGFLAYSDSAPDEWDSIEVPVVPRNQESNADLRVQMRVANKEVRAVLAGTAAALSAFYWSMGLRFFYLAICIGGWVASPIACLVITTVVVVVMWFWDRTSSHALERSA